MCVGAWLICAGLVLGGCAVERHGLADGTIGADADRSADAGLRMRMDAAGPRDGGTRLDGGAGQGDATTRDGGSGIDAGLGAPPWECDPSDADLVVCLDFEESLTDGSGRGNHAAGTEYDFGEGPEGRSLRLSDASSVQIPHAPSLELDRLTFSVRVRLDALPETGRVAIFDKPGYSIFVFPGGDFWCSGGGTIRSQGTGSLEPDTWSHIACVYDGETMRALVDGVEVDRAETTGTVSTTADPLHLGEDSPSGGDQLIGELDSLRIWRRALADEELPR